METVLAKQKPGRKPMRKWEKAALYCTAIVIILLAALVIGAHYFAARSLPVTEGEVTLRPLEKQVSVIRDENGVPHIKAGSERDLYIAQGYIQAQDRLFQMDLSRRQASGRLSEVVGESTVDNDKFFRTIRLRSAAEKSFAAYSEEGKQVLSWFAEGVNLYMKEAEEKGTLPLEFSILGYKPEPWSEVDSLTIGKYMAYDLGGNWEDQAFRHYLLQHFPEEKAYDLFPSYPEDAPYIISEKDLNIGKSFAAAVIAPEFNGSNNWVVSGKKTASGLPLLANDPHLSLATPSVWYQMHLEAPTVNVSGVIFAGIPGIILGHNESIAWGVTNTGPDVQDLYIEKRNPENPSQFLYMDKWEDAEVVKEPIKVKGESAIDYEVTITRHGPVISEFAHADGKEEVLALRWTAHDPSAELEAILHMNKASNWEEFEAALQNFNTPAQNFVFADKKGNIAYKANGNIPIRKKGDSLLPVPGWTGEYEWVGFIPYDELPRTVNPKEGFISTANNKVISDEYAYHISNQWAQAYRQMRIQEVLREGSKLTVEDMQTLQMDTLNLQAQEFIPRFLKAMGSQEDEQVKKALRILENWNYHDDRNEAAPMIFNQWISMIQTEMFEETIPPETLELFKGKRIVTDGLLMDALEGQPGPWVKEQGGIAELLTSSLKRVLAELEKSEGGNMEEWKWGDYHQVRFNHPLSSVFPLQYIFNSKGGIPVDGSAVTVQAAAVNENGIVYHGGSWRFVSDLSDLTKASHLVGPGQSGHVKSRHYDDQLEAWADGIYHQTKLNGMKGDKLVLKP